MIIDRKHPHCLRYLQHIRESSLRIFRISNADVAASWQDEVSYDYLRSVPPGEYVTEQPMMDENNILDLMEDALARLTPEDREELVTNYEMYAGYWAEQGPLKKQLGTEYPSIYLDATVGCLWLAVPAQLR